MTVAELISQALIDAGVEVITYVPGYGGSDIYRALQTKLDRKIFTSFHEEPAYTICHCAALLGKRSVSLFKTHGIMKAGNAVSDSLYAGTTAGFVTIIPEDTGGTHSDTIIETRPFLDGIGMPWIGAKPDNVYKKVHEAYARSEKEQLPYAIVLDVDDIKSEVKAEWISFTDKSQGSAPPAYKRNIQQHVLAPLFNPYQREVYLAKSSGKNWKNIAVPPIPSIPEATPLHWKKTVESYVPLFRVFKKYRGDFVSGDTGVSSQFCAEPWHCIDAVTYMGGSIPLAIGAYMAGIKNPWAISGDFSFISAGPLGLLEAELRSIPLKVIILNNGKAATTGGQVIPDEALETVLGHFMKYVVRIRNPYDEIEIEKVLKETVSNKGMRIVIPDFRNVS